MRSFALAALSLLALAGGARAQSSATDAHGDPLPPGASARLGTIRYRHDNLIVFAAFTPDGKRVVSMSNDGVACVWEFPSGKRLLRLEVRGGATAQMVSATLSPDGKHLTAFADDGFMRIWDIDKAKETGKMAIGGSTPTPAATTPTALAKAVGRTTPPSPAPVYSPDGKTLMLATSSRVIQLVDLAAGKEIRPNLGHSSPLIGVWFTPDGAQVFTKDAKTTHAWNVATGKDLGASSSIVKMPPTSGSPTIISPDGRLGVTVARFATPVAARAVKAREAYLFETASGKQLGVIELDVEIAPMHRRPLLFSPDSKLLATVGGDARQKIDLYDAATGKLLRSLDTGAPPPGGGKGFAKGGPFAAANQRMLFSTDGKALAFQGSADAPIVVLDTDSGKKLTSLSNVEGRTLQGTFTPDRRCLVLESGHGVVTIFELATGQARRTYGKAIPSPKTDPDEGPVIAGVFVAPAAEKPRTSCAISADGALLALPGPGGSVRVWDILGGNELPALAGHSAAVSALAFSPNGKLLASASGDTTALLWDMTRILRPPLAAKVLKPAELEALWQALADEKTDKGFAAIVELTAGSKDAVAWISERLKPAPPLDVKRVETLIRQLGDEQFKVRAAATGELHKLGEPALPFLEKALAAPASPEAQRRLEDLRNKLDVIGLEGERLRAFRAIEVLERIAAPEARRLLESLAAGAPGALVTRSAERALKR